MNSIFYDNDEEYQESLTSEFYTTPSLAGVVDEALTREECMASLDEHIVYDEEHLMECRSQFCEEYGLKSKFEVKKYNYVARYTGDDVFVVANNLIIPFLYLYVDEHFLKVKISRKDTGVSYHWGNYVEDWILMPIGYDSQWTNVMNSAASSVPWQLEPLKLKLQCIARKQSELGTNLETKFDRIVKHADWINRSHPFYDFHQNAKILALCNYSLRKCRFSPQQTKAESGCGGAPPWNNVYTAYTMLHYIRGGSTCEATLKIMEEATAVLTEQMKPSETRYLKSTFLAQADWELFKTYIDNMDSETLIQEIEEKTTEAMISLLPERYKNLTNLGHEFSIEDVSEGPLIAKLRSKGLIKTELDLRIELNSIIQDSCFLDETRTIGEALSESRIEGSRYKRKFLPTLCSRAKKKLNDFSYPYVIETLDAFYAARLNNWEKFSSFCYDDRIKIYSSQQVHNCLYQQQLESVYACFMQIPCHGMYFGIPLLQLEHEEKVDYFDAVEWLRQYKHGTYTMNFMETDIVQDDIRIVHNIRCLTQRIFPTQRNDHLMIVITNDDALCRLVSRLIKELDLGIRFYQMPVYQYVEGIRNPGILEKYSVYSVLSGKMEALNATVTKCIEGKVGRADYVYFQFDLPNVNKFLSTISLLKHGIGFIKVGPNLSKDNIIKLENLTGISLAKQDLNKIHQVMGSIFEPIPAGRRRRDYSIFVDQRKSSDSNDYSS